MVTKIDNFKKAQHYCLEQSHELQRQVNLLFTSMDRFLGEFIPEEDNIIRYLSGFTGENATLLINSQSAYLWVDSRFFLQAPKQVFSGIEVKHYEDEPFKNTLNGILNDGHQALYIDGRYLSAHYDEDFKHALCVIKDNDYVNYLWKDKKDPFWGMLNRLTDDIGGGSVDEKIADARALLEEKRADAVYITSPEDVSYLLNLRQHSTPYTILVQGHILLDHDNIYLFTQGDIMDVKDDLIEYHIHVNNFSEEEQIIKNYHGSILLYKPQVTYRLFKLIQKPILLETNYFENKRSVKTPEQIDLIKEDFALEDRIVSYFLYNIKKGTVKNEWEASEYLEKLRHTMGQERYITPSFASIVAYGPNSAIVHYTPSKEQASDFGNRGFVLCDVGGQYACATTDLTRTVMLGEPTAYEKEMYTRVLKGHIALEKVKFPRGLNGSHLDSLCRQFLWDVNKDYGHGTGHGVDACGAVHAGPNSFKQMSRGWSFQEGMLTSDEPGYYETNHFGIRLENVINCICVNHNESQKDLLGFESMAYVPFDKICIDFDLLTKDELAWLATYQNKSIDLLLNKIDENMDSDYVTYLLSQKIGN